jgi:TrmH family RNA methyltransferase
MSDTDAPQGLLAVCRVLTSTLADVLARRPRLLVVLAHVRDPGNAGTVLRGADAAGADAVIVSEASVDVFGPKVVRSTAGSLFHVPVVTGLPVPQILAELAGAGITRLAADGAGTRLLPEVDLTRPHAWVMGNEAWGLPQPLREACDEVVRVPIFGHAESLNLAMAATVCLYASALAQHPAG